MNEESPGHKQLLCSSVKVNNRSVLHPHLPGSGPPPEHSEQPRAACAPPRPHSSQEPPPHIYLLQRYPGRRGSNPPQLGYPRGVLANKLHVQTSRGPLTQLEDHRPQ